MAARGEVPSPCIKVCQVEETAGRCRGCLRTLDEIAAWSSMTPSEKRAVLLSLTERRRAVVRATGPAPCG